MKVFFEKNDSDRKLVSECASFLQAMDDIKLFIFKKNPKYKIHYFRYNFAPNEIEVDVGSWTEFFYITDYSQEEYEEYFGRKKSKQVFITNGMARCGKDTFATFLNELTPTLKYSSIDKIKEVAKFCGWNGGKTEKDRKFLSDLKVLTSEYNDTPFNAVKEAVEAFNKDKEHKVLLIDIREPQEIEKAKQAFGAKTILIENKNVQQISSNMADAGVYDYAYDFVIQNNGTLEEFKDTVRKFYEEYIK
jgi:hypothetical protein